jgi:predicted nucleotidyltransferase
MESTSVLLAPDLSRDALLIRLKALRPAFVREGITRMWLVGSRARGDNRRDSDVDLMVEIDETRKFSLLDLIGVKHIVEDEIGLPADMLMRRSLSPATAASTARDAIRVL